MENPFRYGSIVSGEYFAGREHELAELELDMQSGQNVVIVSPRRYGKTSLVLAVAERLRAQGMLVAYFDLLTTPNKALLANGLATALYAGLGGFKERAWHKVSDFFGKSSIRPSVTFGPDGTPGVELGLGERARDADSVLARLLELPGQVAKDQKRKVAVVLDEFQEAPVIDEHLPALVRSAFQMQPNISHVFLGSKRHMMQRLFTDHNEPLYRMAKPVVLGPIDLNTFATFIKDRFDVTDQKITDDAVARILEITDCQPHDTQEVAHFTWNIAAMEQVVATSDTVERALDRVLHAENARYTELWSRLTKQQRLVLSALAASGGTSSIYSEAYRQQYRLGVQSSVQRSLAKLLQNDLVEESSPGEYRVPDPFLRAWLARMTKTFSGTGSISATATVTGSGTVISPPDPHSAQ